MATREEELSKLHEIKKLLDRKKKLSDRTEQLRKEHDDYLSKIDAPKYERLPTNNEYTVRLQEEETANNLKKEAEKRAKKKSTIISILMAVPIGLILTGLLLIACLAYDPEATGDPRTWDISEWGEFVQVDAIISVIVFAISKAVIGTKVLKSELRHRDKTESSNAAIRAAKEIDKRNQKENQRRHEEAKKFAQEKIQGKLDAMDQERARLDDEMRQIDKSIAEMNLISKDDLWGIDYLIERISSRRADSLKEALRDLDVRREKANQEAIARIKEFDAQCERDRLRREQERREEEQFWSDMRERERRREHEKKVEDELQRMRQMLEDD